VRADFSEIVDLVARLWLWVRIGARFLGGCGGERESDEKKN
jgi:hypothetical protein